MAEVSSPHDRFFKVVFSREEESRDFLSNYLPAEVVRQLDLSTLNVQKDSFIDTDLKASYSDLLYRVQLTSGEQAYVYTLLEHKSQPEPLIAFQLLRYMVRIWENCAKQETAKKLPVIIPLVLYHGLEAWSIRTNFHSLFETTNTLADYVPDFRYTLHSLNSYRDADLVGMASVRLALWVLKHIFDDNIHEQLPSVANLLHTLAKTRSGFEFLATTLRYMVVRTEPEHRQTVMTALKTALFQKGDDMKESISIYDLLTADSFEKGIEKGIEKGALMILRESIQDITKTRFSHIPPIIGQFVVNCQDEHVLRFLLTQAAIVDSAEVLVHEIAELRATAIKKKRPSKPK